MHGNYKWNESSLHFDCANSALMCVGNNCWVRLVTNRVWLDGVFTEITSLMAMMCNKYVYVTNVSLSSEFVWNGFKDKVICWIDSFSLTLFGFTASLNWNVTIKFIRLSYTDRFFLFLLVWLKNVVFLLFKVQNTFNTFVSKFLILIKKIIGITLI